MVHIIVPIKTVARAKSRLATHFPQEMRQILARCMSEHVLTELAHVKEVTRVIVATSDPVATELSNKLGFSVLRDQNPSDGLNRVIDDAVQIAIEEGARDIGVVMADLPCFDRDDFSELLRGHLAGPQNHVTLVTDRHANGTNIRLSRPGNLVNGRYGPGSFDRHRRAASDAGALVSVVNEPALMLDVDCFSDLDATLDWADVNEPPMTFPLVLLQKWQPLWQSGGTLKCA